MRAISDDIDRDGFAFAAEGIPASRLDGLRVEADRVFAESESQGGARNLLGKNFGGLIEQGAGALRPRWERDAPAPCQLPCEAKRLTVLALAKAVIGEGARPTKLTLFNKTPDANWVIRWHQDATIAVREKHELPGYSGWSMKGGVPHVHPPAEVLEKVLAIRLHLDDTPADNGALKVLPGTHRMGRLTRERIAELRGEIAEEVCEVPGGGMMLMRPLLLHASAKAAAPGNRRVLHFEFSAEPLGGRLEWA